jgi:hypothetical protein
LERRGRRPGKMTGIAEEMTTGQVDEALASRAEGVL